MADIVTSENFQMYKNIFALEVGHTEDCVEETVNIMGKMMGKICNGLDVPLENILEKIGVEQFDIHLRAILNDKDCDCLEKMKKQ